MMYEQEISNLEEQYRKITTGHKRYTAENRWRARNILKKKQHLQQKQKQLKRYAK